MSPARAQPVQLDNCTIWTSGATRTIGTTGKGRDNQERDHRGQCPESRVPGCPGSAGRQRITGAAPGKETWATDWQHRQGNQARCRFEGRDAPVVRAVARTSRKLLATLHGTGLTECSRDCRAAGTLVSIEAGSGAEGHDARQQCRRQLLRSFGVEMLSFLVPSPLSLFFPGERADRLVYDAKSPPGLVRWSVVRQTSHVVSARIPGCVLCSGAGRKCPLSGCLGLCRRFWQAETSLWGLWGDVLATCAYLVQESERWSL